MDLALISFNALLLVAHSDTSPAILFGIH
jgi:hypothetical protein